jgi:nucleotide-binding universal stress UspA family protein
MNIPHRILMGTDFSDYSKEALGYAVLLTKQFGADLYLLHVFEVPVYIPALGSAEPEEWHRAVMEGEKKRLEALRERSAKGGAVHPNFKEGAPFREILKTAKEVAANLIVSRDTRPDRP